MPTTAESDELRRLARETTHTANSPSPCYDWQARQARQAQVFSRRRRRSAILASIGIPIPVTVSRHPKLRTFMRTVQRIVGNPHANDENHGDLITKCVTCCIIGCFSFHAYAQISIPVGIILPLRCTLSRAQTEYARTTDD